MSNEKVESNKVLVFASPLKRDKKSLSLEDAFALYVDSNGKVTLKVNKTRDNTINSSEIGLGRIPVNGCECNWRVFRSLLHDYNPGDVRIILGILIDKKYLDTKESDAEIWCKMYPQEYEDMDYVKNFLKDNPKWSNYFDPSWRCMLSSENGIFQLHADEIKVLGALVISNENNDNRKEILYLNEDREMIIKRFHLGPGIRRWSPTKKLYEVDDTILFQWASNSCCIEVFKSLNEESISVNDVHRIYAIEAVTHEFKTVELESIKKYKDKITLFREKEQTTNVGFHFSSTPNKNN